MALVYRVAVLVTATLGFVTLGCEAPPEEAHRTVPTLSDEEITMLPPDGGSQYNRLIHETSPYLLQHAQNPVDWYPWGDEAFEKARKEDKPIFLSVGYSTCHWCHVMERESFENEEIAALLNEHFVPIKIDREERPDVDEIYMNATQLMTGHGGWPNSVWLMPDGRPWHAGTYFPPDDRRGRPGLKTLLRTLAEFWDTRRADIEKRAADLSATMRRIAGGAETPGFGEPTRDLVEGAIGSIRSAFDEWWGGFGGAPKFPPHGSLRLLFYEYDRTQDEALLPMATRTLDAMAEGGIRDHVGGGFHRYSTDAKWFLPHFEKMLYDNAQLVRIYVDAYRITGDGKYRDIATEICEWVLRDMVDERGGFYCALDADSEGEEGKFYLWDRKEILSILGEDRGEVFGRVYGVEGAGNYQDEATGHRPGTNLLFLPRSLDVSAKVEKIERSALECRLAEDRAKLLDVRNRRVWPHLDDKVLASWNGLMIGSLAHAGQHLDEPKYTAAAEKAAEFLLTEMRREGRLFRSYRDGRATLHAYLDDYAFTAAGLLDLHEATGNPLYLEEARALVEVLIEHYHDDDRGGFFFVADDHEELLTRSRDPLDRAIPSGNGVAACVLIRLSRLTGEARYRELAGRTIEAFAGFMAQAPRSTESLILATGHYLGISD
ncbi:MAG: thioredoxin domain-containing protein [Candidatus Eisenbacteria sp.]|nr:thioredoxin domain-containing protein [Candidatus Eisenbacteria bacterium]